MARQASELGGEVKLRENLPVIGDILASVHYKVLLTPDNISAVRRNPAPYTLPVIPRPLPSDVVEGEYFVIADLRRLVSSSAHSSGGPVVEASSRVQGS